MTQALVIDDSYTTRLFYRQTLEAAAFAVEEAINAVEGLEKATLRAFDLLLVDVNMPGMDGYALMAQIRSTPELRALPAIMISTEARDEDRRKAWSAGANFYLVKPIAPDELVTVASLMTGRTAAAGSAP